MNFDKLAAFQDRLIERGIGGSDCAIYVGFDPVYRHFSGWQNREAYIHTSQSTLYRMFSMTKPVTCAAAMQLFEQGEFLLNDPLSDYLPEFRDMQVRERLADGSEILRPAKNPIRVQNLFEMTAGLDYNMEEPALKALYEETGFRFNTRQFAQALARGSLLFEPGTHWRYSLAHDVLGALIEVISGMTFDQYLKKNVFEPLGMKTACFRESEIDKSRLCRRYGFDENRNLTPGPQENRLQPSENFFSGGAGLTMTVDDYARFACAMTNRGVSKEGVRLLSGRTVDLMRTNRLCPAALADYQMPDTRPGYGYGLGVRTLIDPAASGSPGARGEFGWGGAWGTYVVMDPENHVTLVYAEQGVDTQAGYIQRRLRNMAYTALEWNGLI